jgi:hypothetical protein
MILSIDLQDLQLKFQVLDTPVADLWTERMQQRHAWPLDDNQRFYGFDSREVEQGRALAKINRCIQQIQAQQPAVRQDLLTTVYDQDTLNYWHHVFETQHGFLNQEDQNNPLTAVLAELNVAVHRCESVAHGNRPRFVCTWYGMPKTKTLPVELMQQYGTTNPGFGTVCLNYCEIGKTLEDLSRDRDAYISKEAFRPFNHYSADFVVRMFEEPAESVAEKIVNMHKYFDQHKDFFFERGYTTYYDPRLLPLRFPVAQLIETQSRDQLLTSIANNQKINQVTLQ